MIQFSKLLAKRSGDADTILATSPLERPLDMKNSSLGRMDLSGLHKSTRVCFAMMRVIWVLVNPCFLKHARTESGLPVASNFTQYFDADSDRAFSGVNPHDFTR